MSDSSEVLCILALTLAACLEVPSLDKIFCCSHIMSSVIGVCSYKIKIYNVTGKTGNVNRLTIKKRHLNLTERGDQGDKINKQDLDPRANGTWLSKLTE